MSILREHHEVWQIISLFAIIIYMYTNYKHKELGLRRIQQCINHYMTSELIKYLSSFENNAYYHRSHSIIDYLLHYSIQFNEIQKKVGGSSFCSFTYLYFSHITY